MTITNDGATILGLLEVEHPAAKVLVDLAQLQDKEVGDGTTSVVSAHTITACFDCADSKRIPSLYYRLSLPPSYLKTPTN